MTVTTNNVVGGMSVPTYAHSLPQRPPSEWQELDDHLKAVAKLAEKFAGDFGAEKWARLAGLWHDVGKYSGAFQQYLNQTTSPDPHIADSAARTDHSTAGAQHAVAKVEILGHILAYVIAGHHSGLLDGRSEGACLEARLGKSIEPWSDAPPWLVEPGTLEPPPLLRRAFSEKDAFAVSFFTRMLFSCLVDADFLNTESFMNPQRATARPMWPEEILKRMADALDGYIAKMGPNPSPVNYQRALVRRACLEASELPPGLFSLTVPTGGGKTFSSLAFGLRHALNHGLRRVIYVIPFTSIIEQNAEEFRKAMGRLRGEGIMDPIIEHHSNLDVGKESFTSRLATENWDAPLVVSTSVQFYESLFAKRTSRCRKLHNLARAVIILDEVQTLPVDYLEPCLRALRELTRSYGASVVLCTATQPAVHYRQEFPIGLEGVREIIPEPKRLYKSLQRVRVSEIGKQDDEALADRLLKEKQVLCVVNTRGHARKLFEALGEAKDRFHLSALMCPAHRSRQLNKIRKRLRDQKACRVISTQLIEAGVDIDFPVVYRSLAGLDSIAQAAGRCNRNGRLPEKGRTFVFRSEHTRSEQFLAETANSASQVLPLHEDPLSLEAIEHYFKLYYWDQSSRWDAKKILRRFHLLNDHSFPFSFEFSKVARDFRLIETAGEPVIIPWRGQGLALCEELRRTPTPPPRELLRKLQRFTVQVPRRTWNLHVGRAIQLVHDRYPVLVSPEIHYSERTGLSLGEDFSTFLNA